MEQKFYSAITKNEDTWKKSSSGGAFTEISDIWLKQNNAVVYGAKMLDDLSVAHVRVDSAEGRNELRGSKYIGSDVSDIYKTVIGDLLEGKRVLFSGTPCQIAALNKILETKKDVDTENLLTVEVVCHGAGSTSFFRDYVSYYEKKYGSKAKSVSFRGKHTPTVKQDMQITFENGKVFNSFSTRFDWYYSIFSVRNYLLRPSCYKCRFAKMDREADITLADLWVLGENAKARSLVVINTDKGDMIWKDVSPNMDVNIENGSEVHQPHMHAPCTRPEDYEKFWDIYVKDGFLEAEKYIGNNTFKGKAQSSVAFVLDKLHLKNAIKSLIRK